MSRSFKPKQSHRDKLNDALYMLENGIYSPHWQIRAGEKLRELFQEIYNDGYDIGYISGYDVGFVEGVCEAGGDPEEVVSPND